MIEKIKERLSQLGYKVSEEEETSLTFLIRKTDNYIMGYCNINEMPDEIIEQEVDYICAEFLKDKAMNGQLPESFELVKVSSITEGDTSVSYEKGSNSISVTDFFFESESKLKLAMQPFKCMRW